MKEFIATKSQEAKDKYLQEREKYDLLIKNAVEEAAAVGLNTACVSIQATWFEMKLVERYLADLGCYNIDGGSNYSWKHIHFDF